MRRFPRGLLAAALPAGLLYVADPVRAQVADSAGAAASIAESAAAFSRALEGGDATAMTGQYVDDATLIPPGGRLVTGRDAILAFWTPRNPEFRTLEHSLTTDRLVVSGDVAMEVGTWRQRGQLRQEVPTESAGRYLVVWRRQPDGSWRMQFDSWTAPFPED
jgi:ketosteroid isomerase-like protein